MSRSSLVVSCAAATATLVFSGSAPARAEIQVQVNGQPVVFRQVGPQKVGGRVLIPLRAVVESLGAEVKWEAATQTVHGRKGSHEFTLAIGGRTATVDGNSVSLDVPAQLIAGNTMVPLRFVAEAVGAEVEWNAAAQQVAIRDGGGEAPVAGGDRISGDLVSVRRGPEPTITVQANGVRQTYRINRDSVLLRGPAGARGTEVELDQLRPGDRVRIRLGADGSTAELVEATTTVAEGPARPDSRGPDDRERVSGEVVSIRRRDDRTTLVIQTPNGRESYDVSADTEISRGGDGQPRQRGDLRDLKIGDRVRFSADRDGRISRLRVTSGAAEPIPVPPVPDSRRLSGEIVSIRPGAKPPTLTIRSGGNRTTVEITPDTVLFRSAGPGARAVRVGLNDLTPGDQARIRTDATGTTAEVVDVEGTAAAIPPVPVPVPLPAEPARDLRISSLTHSATGMLREGSEVRVALVGTPGAMATFDAGTVAKDVPFHEDPQRPGHYTGSFVVPRGVTAHDVPIIAQLRMGARTAPLLQAAATLNVDSDPPRITDAAPADRSTTNNPQPDIYAEISDGPGSGIDRQSLKVTVRGQDVSGDVKVTPRFLLYTPHRPLPPGPIPVTITIRDMAGNETRTAWSFNVASAPAVIRSVTHNGDRPLRVGEELVVTVQAQPNARGSFRIGDLNENVPLRETAAGTYVGRYRVRAGEEVAQAPVTVELTTADGERVRQKSTVPVNFLTAPARRPTITAPADMVRLQDELAIEGTAAPGSKVRVEVIYTAKAFGALPVRGTFGSREATADRQGRWATEPFPVRLPLGVRRPDLQIRAVAIDAAGQESEPASVTVTTR